MSDCKYCYAEYYEARNEKNEKVCSKCGNKGLPESVCHVCGNHRGFNTCELCEFSTCDDHIRFMCGNTPCPYQEGEKKSRQEILNELEAELKYMEAQLMKLGIDNPPKEMSEYSRGCQSMYEDFMTRFLELRSRLVKSMKE